MKKDKFGLISLILGVISIVMGLFAINIPLALAELFVGVSGLVFGIIGLKTEMQQKAINGIILSCMGSAIALVWFVYLIIT
ncbi:MAG: hypothetical protein WCS56_03750 [Bacilli bacterium]